MHYQEFHRHKRIITLQQRASAMRAQSTHAEELLWRKLRGGQLGVSFRRQVVLGERYIADFYAPRARLVVEVDGRYHEASTLADTRRDRVLERLGCRVLRLSNELVEQDLQRAVAAVREVLRKDR